jgi:Xaa-Pro aminopeptidase
LESDVIEHASIVSGAPLPYDRNVGATIDITGLHLQRNRRLREVMSALDVPALLTADPINIGYACGHRNMTVYGMMGPSRFVMVIAGGPTIMFEFAGCDHLSLGLPAVDEVRTTSTITANSGSAYRTSLERFAAEVASELRRHHPHDLRLAVEKVDFEFTDALRATGVALLDGMAVMLEARRIKQPIELEVMRVATDRVDASVAALEASLHDGVTENEAWAEFHRHLIANDGEYVVARLFQSGPNTFPYFRESSDRPMRSGELVCLDTDATGYLGYAVDFSRTFVCGGGPATAVQRDLFGLAYEQLLHNSMLLADGVTYEAFAAKAWPMPDKHRPFGYYCLAHGLGVSGEHPNVPLVTAGQPYDFAGRFETDMVVCIESYIGDPDTGQGVKLEDEFVITAGGAERISTYPFSDALM